MSPRGADFVIAQTASCDEPLRWCLDGRLGGLNPAEITLKIKGTNVEVVFHRGALRAPIDAAKKALGKPVKPAGEFAQAHPLRNIELRPTNGAAAPRGALPPGSPTQSVAESLVPRPAGSLAESPVLGPAESLAGSPVIEPVGGLVDSPVLGPAGGVLDSPVLAPVGGLVDLQARAPYVRVPKISLTNSLHGVEGEAIKAKLLHAAKDPNCNITVFGYSPTGGGHTARTLDIIRAAVDTGKIAEGSVVIFHVPQKWGTNPRPAILQDLASYLKRRGVEPILAEAEKSVLGFFNDDGSSNAPLISEHFATQPKRPDAGTDIRQAWLLEAQRAASNENLSIVLGEGARGADGGDARENLAPGTLAIPQTSAERRISGLTAASVQSLDSDDAGNRTTDSILGSSLGENVDIQNLPTLSASSLMGSLKEIVGEEVMQSKVFVLTDMDPTLQKAAQRAGIPPKQRVDQQNHAILLKTEGDNYVEGNIKPENALVGKILDTYGAMPSHIGLGDKNTLLAMKGLADSLGLSESTTKLEARGKVVEHLLTHGKVITEDVSNLLAPDAEGNLPRAVTGIMKHKSVQSQADIGNVVYVYAHGMTNRIAAKVQEELRNEQAPDHYKKTMFVFAGKDVVRDGADALKLAYLADGDGITTSGAGTHGEYAYLHFSGGSKAGLLALPIKNHPEQIANADKLRSDDRTESMVTKLEDQRNLEREVDTWLRQRMQEAPGKYPDAQAPDSTMRDMLQAVSSTETYVSQGLQLLFGQKPAEEVYEDRWSEIQRIIDVETALHESPLMAANRGFSKMVFQALDVVEEHLEGNAYMSMPIHIKLKKGDDSKDMHFKNLGEFARTLGNIHSLREALHCTQLKDNSLPSMNLVRSVFNELAFQEHGDKMRMIENFKTEFGSAFKTGF